MVQVGKWSTTERGLVPNTIYEAGLVLMQDPGNGSSTSLTVTGILSYKPKHAKSACPMAQFKTFLRTSRAANVRFTSLPTAVEEI